MITAKFGSKTFEVSNKKIYTPKDLSITEALNTEDEEVVEKKSALNIKGINPQDLSFDVWLDCRFVDVVAEIRFWKSTLLSQKSQMFSLGNYTIGKFYLVQYDFKESQINKDGEIISGTITLTFKEDGEYANRKKINFDSTKKAESVKSSASSKAVKVRIGSTIKPKSGVRWYYTAEGALKKTGKSGKAYQKNMKVTHTYSKSGKLVCVNPEGLGWLKVEDMTVVKY